MDRLIFPNPIEKVSRNYDNFLLSKKYGMFARNSSIKVLVSSDTISETFIAHEKQKSLFCAKTQQNYVYSLKKS